MPVATSMESERTCWSLHTTCIPGNVILDGTPCIGRARERRGGRVGRSGTKEGMGTDGSDHVLESDV
jgi:hypothetical protein